MYKRRKEAPRSLVSLGAVLFLLGVVVDLLNLEIAVDGVDLLLYEIMAVGVLVSLSALPRQPRLRLAVPPRWTQLHHLVSLGYA